MDFHLRALAFAVFSCLASASIGVHAANETYLRVSCEGADAGAEITVNGVFKGECPIDLQVRPGTISIRAVKRTDATHEQVFAQEFKMGEGTAKRIEIVLSKPTLTASAIAAETARQAAAAAAQAAREQKAADELRKLESAAEARDPASMTKLAQRYEYGMGVPLDRELALAWYRRAANAGHLAAKGAVGAFASNGWIGGKPDPALAREICEPGAAAGDPRCMLIMSRLYLMGAGGLPKDAVLSDEWLERASSAGLPRAMNYRALGLLPKRAPEALTLAMRAIQPGVDDYPGEAEAYYTIGYIYANGPEGIPKDESKALEWFVKGAEAGSGKAMNQLGVMHSKGSPGTPKDDARAVAWWRKAAQAGDPTAMGNLGLCYHRGLHGIAKNDALAIEWYSKALAAGDERVRANLQLLKP